ncbi:M20 family metallopeptidase [Alkalihalobacillus sp. CinArs1]|uniref:M20 family metallopeptidase n=1 Tax=Alkalihalobacillus sp. CinArs1 TaxID=2995314 RepID=UPI0022DDE16C|nr:M20 family metallopeptidase [Alkalihalobacillus sp. CinArs1]
MNQLFNKLEDLYSEMVELRRHFHQYPELSFEEVETPKLIANYHRELGHDVREHVGGRGVVATLKGTKPGKTVALRADFDALPIQEENEVPYKSKVDGVMHACGHDGHTAILLCLAKALNAIQNELEGTIVFIHQHAEEYQPGGAIAMIEDGCLEGVDVVFGTHLRATEEMGKIMYKEGPFMAAADRFEIEIIGRGGHGAQPHLTKDSIVIASQLVVNLQQLVSRRVNPLDSAVLSVGTFDARNAFNVIANNVQLVGTVRTFKKNVKELMEKEIERVVRGTCLAADVDYKLNYVHGYPALVNHKTETELLKNYAKLVPDVKEVTEHEAQMGGEDFSYYLQHVPGTFFFTGALNQDAEQVYPHHHPRFSFDERAMLIAAKVMATAALSYSKSQRS